MIPTSKKPKILFVTPFWPHRTGIGSEVRARLTLEALQAVGDVDVAVLDDAETSGAETAKPPISGVGKQTVFKVCERPRSGLAGKVRWLLDSKASYPHGCGVPDESAATFMKNLAAYDLVWFFKLRSPNMFPEAAWPKSVLDIDDVPSTYERVTLENGGDWRSRLQARVRLLSWRRRERLLGERFSVLGVCSDGDRDYLKALGVKSPIHVIPNGFAKPASVPVPNPASPPRLGFIGLFEYRPNHEGIQWFAEHCWPRIKAAVPAARLRLVGLGSDGSLKPNGSEIDGLGWLADPAEEIASWSGMVVPIRLGAGTRVKIAQGFGQKCPMVSTSLGAYGYNVANGRELFIADTAADFADACVRLIQEPDSARQMAERAWQQFLDKWTWDAIRPRVQAAAKAAMT